MSKKFVKREYDKNYYFEVTKPKREQLRKKEKVEQPTLFDADITSSTKTQGKARKKITMLRSEAESVSLPDTDKKMQSDTASATLTTDTPKLSANNNIESVSLSERTDNVRHFESVSLSDKCQTLTLNSMADQLTNSIQQLAFDRLFPSAKRSLNFWTIAELIGLILLSGGLLFFAAQAVAIVDQKLLPLVVLLELVTMFFSLTLAKWSGFNFSIRALLLLVCVGLTNFLVAKATFSLGESEITRGEARAEQSQILKSEVMRQQSLIADLQSRGRITVAREESKRLDALMSKLEATGVGVVVDRSMVWVQVVVRVILGLSILLINHQISEIFVKRKFLKFS